MDNNDNEVKKEETSEIIDISLQSDHNSLSIKESMKLLENGIKPFAEIAKQITIGLTPALRDLLKAANKISVLFSKVDYSQMLARLNSFRENFAKLVSDLSLPLYSEDKICELQASFATWGKFGWTCNPLAPWKMLYELPEDQKRANSIARKYCKDINRLFEEIEKSHRVKRDFIEAKNVFNQGHYKSCVLLLFSMIDACLIRMQKRVPNNRRGVRKALRAIQSQMTNDEKTLFQMLFLLNYSACIDEMYCDAKDFINQPLIINRNFVAHGMLWRDVKKQDCLQLFLLYYNTLQMIDMMYDS